MNEIKKMLLGIAIMLAAIAFHLFLADGLITDFFALLGFTFVIIGYCAKNKADADEEV